jgi:hypothetical protein
MKYLSININNRKKHQLQLSAGSTAQTGQFIIQRENQVNVLLFSISVRAKLLARAGTDHDSYLDWSSLQMQSDEGTLILSLKSEKEVFSDIKTENLPKVDGLSIGYKHGRIIFSLEPDKVTTGLKVIINVESEIKTSIQGVIQLHISEKSQIFDLVMDFGSEASQVVIYPRGSEHHILTRLNLVEILRQYFYQNLKGKTLHQTVTEDKELYRSAFFIKKNGSVFDMHGIPGKNGDKEFLNLLTDIDDIDRLSVTHFLVSNLKLAHLGAYKFNVNFESTATNAFKANQKDFIDTIGKLQQSVINYILQAVLRYLRDSNQENRPIYLAVRLLVPNVFDQSKVSTLVQRTLSALTKISKTTPDLLLEGSEVSTISESDASFLGFKSIKDKESQNGLSPSFIIGKRYLIIDVGKGTTDFSIVEINAADSGLSSLYRSGFIGAGNVLSYAFVDTIFAAIFGEDSSVRKRAIYDICLSPVAGLADKLRFVELVEKLKRNFEQKSGNAHYKSLEQLIPAELKDIRNEYAKDQMSAGLLDKISKALTIVIDRQGSIKDEFLIIHDTVTKMVNRIAKEVFQTGYYTEELCDKIILTGRGFKFEMLVEEIEKVFKKPILMASDLKKVCLLGAFTGEKVNYDSNLVGKPNIYQVLSPNNDKEKVKEVDMGAELPKLNLPLFNRLRDFTKGLESVTKALNGIDKHLEARMKGKDEFAQQADTADTYSQGFDLTNEEKFFLEGTPFSEFNKNAKTISVSGIDYKKHEVNSPNINICFTGDEFLIRDATTSSPLDVYPSFFKEDPYVFQTLFPFADVSEPKEIEVRKLIE